jgi:electron transfer flavoprotein beta subunit
MRGIMSARTKPLTVVEPVSHETQAEATAYQLPPAKGAVKLVDKDQVSELVKLLKNEAKVL